MKKFIWLIICFILICTSYAFSQKNEKQTYIFGHLTNEAENFQISITLTKVSLPGIPDNSTEMPIKLNAGGYFKLRLGALEKPARLIIYASSGNPGHSPSLLVNPGDSIEFNISLFKDKGFNWYSTMKFSGRGASKFQCVQEIGDLDKAWQKALFSIPPSLRFTSAEKVFPVYDSLMNSKLNILNKYKSKLTESDYQILRADLSSKFCSSLLGLIEYKLRYPKEFSIEECKRDFKSYRKYVPKFTTYGSRSAFSESYVRSLYYEYSLEVALGANKREENECNYTDFVDFVISKYNILNFKNNYSIRDYLLAYFLLRNSQGGNTGGMENYEKAFQHSIAVIQNPELKSILSIRNRIMKGKPAYDFNLPMDSTGKRLRLSDLRGKVVLIDNGPTLATDVLNFRQHFTRKFFHFLEIILNFNM